MIYIDPPYNTGNDFVYNDSFSMNKEESDILEGDISELGDRYTVNSKSSNKYHANWLNMMYPRLRIAKDLLKDDGVIFLSIDDNEVFNLKKICDEIFGEGNFVDTLIWKKLYGGKNDSKWFLRYHDYILVYAKNKDKWYPNLLPRTEEQNNRYKNPDNDVRGPWTSADFTAIGETKSCIYQIITPAGNKILPPEGKRWIVNEESCIQLRKDNRLWFGTEGNNFPRIKRFLSEVKNGVSQSTILDYSEVGHSDEANKELKSLLNGAYFDYPKPTRLLQRLIHLGSNDNDIILDFFSGSATTAEAVMKINAENKESRKYIMIQIPELITEKKSSDNTYSNICEIAKDRIKRAGDKIKEENKDKEGINNLDIGFKVFKVADTNIRWIRENDELRTLASEITSKESIEQTTFNYIAATTSQVALDEVVSPKDRLDFMPGFEDIDVVYELLLRQRDIPLSAKVRQLVDIGQRTYLFDESFLVCLEEDITNELVEKLASINPLPLKFILRDSAFGDDINLKDETNRRLKTLIERNTGETKKTYTVEYI